MTEQLVAPYGSWRSPIAAEMLAEDTVRLGEVVVNGDAVYWIESRPAEAGRSVIVSIPRVSSLMRRRPGPGAAGDSLV